RLLRKLRLTVGNTSSYDRLERKCCAADCRVDRNYNLNAISESQKINLLEQERSPPRQRDPSVGQFGASITTKSSCTFRNGALSVRLLSAAAFGIGPATPAATSHEASRIMPDAPELVTLQVACPSWLTSVGS